MRPLDVFTYQMVISLILKHQSYALFIDNHRIDRIVALTANVYALGVCYEDIEWAILNSIEYNELSDFLYESVRRH